MENYDDLIRKHIIVDPELSMVKFSLKDLKRTFETPNDVEEYARIVLETDGITDVCLSGNTFGVGAGRALARALKCQDKIRKVDLSDVFTRRNENEIPLVIDAFAESLADKKYLEEIDLSDNAFGPAGAKPLAKLLSENCRIKRLIMNNNGLGSEGVKYISNALESAHKRAQSCGELPMLDSLYLGRNRIGNEGVRHLSNAIKIYSSKLSTFSLPQNGISSSGIEELVDSLSHCNLLTDLNLQDNTFNMRGSLAFAKAVPKWSMLTSVNVSDCLFTPDGGIEVIKALTNGNRFLKHIDLGYNDIDRRGALLIPKMLKNKLLLLNIDLNGNMFAAAGPHIDKIKSALVFHDRSDCLGPLDDMDEDEDFAMYNDEFEEEEGDESTGYVEEDYIPECDVVSPVYGVASREYITPAEKTHAYLSREEFSFPQNVPENDFVVYTSVPDRSAYPQKQKLDTNKTSNDTNTLKIGDKSKQQKQNNGQKELETPNIDDKQCTKPEVIEQERTPKESEHKKNNNLDKISSVSGVSYSPENDLDYGKKIDDIQFVYKIEDVK